ncbi:microtubule-associated protein 1 light chain 3 gamma-like [Arctopsyche grandis]|uniref:microtubule-associated protein 1 light chain 3 gamma-like n=1 Tax=Arctopsyche grandis TaxID=121162 RepID=UPI00406D9F4F
MALNCVTAKKVVKRDLNSNVRNCFGSRKNFDSKRDEVEAIRSKFPTKIPLIVERYYKERSLPTLDKSKFLVPQEITMSQFLVIIRNRMKLLPNQALYLLIANRSMLSMSHTMAQAYTDYASDDGFLYITYASQEMFGGTFYHKS